MKKTDPGSSAVRKAAMSAFRSSAGPAVCTIGTFSSAAMMLASEVLPRPGRTGEQHVVERLAAAPGGLDEHLELRGDLLLVDEVGQALGAKRAVEVLLAASEAGVGQALRGAVPLGGVAGFPGLLDPGVARDAHVTRAAPSAARRSAASISSSALSPSAPSSSRSASVSV